MVGREAMELNRVKVRGPITRRFYHAAAKEPLVAE